MDRPIPAAYYVYGLRSRTGRARPYVGSTPHPRRRIAQHNGLIAGGASRTARNGRPWDMMFVVAGFTSKIAALQFEWALGNYHLTNFIPTESRLVQPVRVSRVRNGRRSYKLDMPRGQKPKDLFENLHLLLRVKGFSKWPLTVQFLRQDSFAEWQKVTSSIEPPLQPERSVSLSPTCESEMSAEDRNPPDGVSKPQGQLKSDKIPLAVRSLNLTYDLIKPHVQKSLQRLQGGEQMQCRVCHGNMDASKDHILFCTQHHCDMVSHLTCLSSHFLSTESRAEELVPTTGQCPSCNSNINWSDMVRELSLRLRGPKEIQKLLKEPKKNKAVVSEPTSAKDYEADKGLNSYDPMEVEADDGDEVQYKGREVNDDRSDFEDIDMVSDRSDDVCQLPVLKTDSPSRTRLAPTLGKAKIIPDSDWDDIEQISD